MDFGSMMSDVMIGAGQSQISGAEQQQRLANIEDTRAQTQMRQMQALAMKQEMDDKQNAAADMKTGMATVAGGIKTQEDIVKGATAAMTIAASKGNFAEVKVMEDLIGNANKEIKATTDVAIAEKQAKAETAGRSALAYQDNPTPAAAAEVVRNAIAAGVPVQEIPPSTDEKAFARFVETLPGKARSVEKATEFRQAKEKAEADREARITKDKADNEVRLEAIRSTAASQANANATRQLAIATMSADRARAAEAKQERDDRRAEEKAKGLQLTAKQKDTADAVAVMAHEGARSLHGFGKMEAGATTGAFVDLQGHTVEESLTKVGGRLVTGQQAQMFQTNAAGFGRAVLSAETVGIGRSPTAAQIDDIHRAVTPQEGDTYYTAAYKLATGNAIILNRLETRHTNPDPKVEAQLTKDEAYMRTLATPEQVYDAAQKDPKGKRELDKHKKTSDQLMGEIRSGAFAAKMPATPAAPGSLPPGFKED